MKYRNKSFQNIGILVAVVAFLALSFVGNARSAQIRNRLNAAATPKKKATPTPKKKATAKATPTPKSKAKSNQKTTAKTKATPTPKKKTSSTASKYTNSKTTKDTKTSSKKTNTASTKSKPITASVKNKPVSKKPKTTTPVKNKTVTVRSKTTTTPIKTTPTRTDLPQIIVSSLSAAVRSAPSSTASELSRAKLGSSFRVLEKKPGWYKVQVSNQKTGWIPITSAVAADKNGNDEIYKQLLTKNTSARRRSFNESVELYEFLTRVQPEIKDSNTAADFGLKRLVALRAALKAIPAGQSNQKVYQDFIKAQDDNIVYSDPTAEWYVRAPLFWDLHSKYTTTAAGEKIAWEGAKNPLPGECEGYVNCHIFLLRMTDGEYLNYYPNSSHSVEALKNITTFLDPIAADTDTKKVFNGPTDVSDRAEFNSLITELRIIISRLPNPEKERALQQLRKIAEGFK